MRISGDAVSRNVVMRDGLAGDGLAGLAAALAGERRAAAVAQARVAGLCLAYADARRAEVAESAGSGGPRRRIRSAEFVADEVSVVLGVSVWEAQCLVARSRRVRSRLPEVWAAAGRGELCADRVREIDRVARLIHNESTLIRLDDEVVEAARRRTVRQLRSWLERFVARLEPDAAAHRHRVSFADRRVSIAQSVTGMGYVTGEVSAPDAAAIDARLSSLSRGLGADDQRSDQQRRSDLFAGLLLGTVSVGGGTSAAAEIGGLEVEHVDPNTGEFLGVTVEPLEDVSPSSVVASVEETPPAVVETPPAPARVGIVIGLSSLLGVDESPGELVDRSGVLPAELVREIAARSGTLFTRLLVDDRPGGKRRMVDVTELGRFPSAALAELVRIRTGTCGFPTCTVPAVRCDVDHHVPFPDGPTSAGNLDPLCRRHHRAKTFAGLAARRDLDAVEWTLPTAATYRCVDDPLPTPPAPDEVELAA